MAVGKVTRRRDREYKREEKPMKTTVLAVRTKPIESRRREIETPEKETINGGTNPASAAIVRSE